jgi:hypothetical protein
MFHQHRSNDDLITFKASYYQGDLGIRAAYRGGQKDFENLDLKNADLRGLDLRYINLRGSNLSGSNLSETNLDGADLRDTQLSRVNLSKASFRGASLYKSVMAWSNLTEANFKGADLRNVSMVAATLKQANFRGADFSGAYLVGADIQGAMFNGSYYNWDTCFNRNFEPQLEGMQSNLLISAGSMLRKFNYLSKLAGSYVGSKLTTKYLIVSRPESNWLQQFEVDSSAQVKFLGSLDEPINNSELHQSQEWINSFVKYCGKLVRDLPYLISQDKLILGINS